MKVKVNFINITDDELALSSDYPPLSKITLLVTTNPNREGLPNTVFIDYQEDYIKAIIGSNKEKPVNKVLDYIRSLLPEGVEVEFVNTQRAESAIMYVVSSTPAIHDYPQKECIWINEHVTAYYHKPKDAYQLHCTKSFAIVQNGEEKIQVSAGDVGGFVKDVNSLRNLSWVSQRIIVEAGCYLDNSYVAAIGTSGPTLRISNSIVINSIVETQRLANSIVVDSDISCHQISDSFYMRRKMSCSGGSVDNAFILLGDENSFPIADVLRNMPASGGITVTRNHPYAYLVTTSNRLLCYYDLAEQKRIASGIGMQVDTNDELWSKMVETVEIDKNLDSVVAELKILLSTVVANEELANNMNYPLQKPKGSATIASWCKILTTYQANLLADEGNKLLSLYIIIASQVRSLIKSLG